MGDDVIDHPLGPVLDPLADADMPIRWPAGGATAQAGVHVPDPADGAPLDLALKIFSVDMLSPPLQIRVGPPLGQAGPFLQLALDFADDLLDSPVGQSEGHPQQDVFFRLPLPARGFFEPFISPDRDFDRVPLLILDRKALFRHRFSICILHAPG